MEAVATKREMTSETRHAANTNIKIIKNNDLDIYS